jgi:hypothetical protein
VNIEPAHGTDDTMIRRSADATSGRGPGSDADRRRLSPGSRSAAATARRALPTAVAATALTAGTGLAGATPAGRLLGTQAQTGGGIPLVGPTTILVGAILVGAALRLVERVYGTPSPWADDRRSGGTGPPSATRDPTTGSTAGHTIESSTARMDDPPDPTPAGGPTAAGADGSDPDVGPTRHATGTFHTVGGGGTLMVTDPGFRPDLVVLTGASKGPADETGFAEGWSHGIVHRTVTGDLDQFAVSTADTGGGTTGGGIREDAALDLPVSAEGAGTDAVWGKVASAVDEGFQFEVTAPSGHERSATVQYHAVSFPEGTDLSVGTFGFGSEPRRGKVDLGVDADYVGLTATTGARPLTRDAERPVALSHGTVVDRGTDPDQYAVGSAIDGENGAYVASDDRAVYLLHPGDGGIAGRTSMNVTSLGSTMRLTLEDVYDAAPVAFAVYAAVSMPDGADVPATGLTTTPGPERGARTRVDTGFAPGAVTLAANGGAADGGRTVPGSLSMLGWSHGVIDGTPGGLAGQAPVRALVDGERIVRNPVGLGIDDDGFVMAAMEEFEGEPPPLLYTAWPGDRPE